MKGLKVWNHLPPPHPRRAGCNHIVHIVSRHQHFMRRVPINPSGADAQAKLFSRSGLAQQLLLNPLNTWPWPSRGPADNIEQGCGFLLGQTKGVHGQWGIHLAYHGLLRMLSVWSGRTDGRRCQQCLHVAVPRSKSPQSTLSSRDVTRLGSVNGSISPPHNAYSHAGIIKAKCVYCIWHTDYHAMWKGKKQCHIDTQVYQTRLETSRLNIHFELNSTSCVPICTWTL